MKCIYIVVCIVALGLLGCSKTVDGTSHSNFELSINTIMKDMSADEMKSFRNDIRKASAYIQYTNTNEKERAEAFVATLINPNATANNIIQNLHGKTSSEIKSLAKKWDEKKRELDIAQLLKEIEKEKTTKQKLEDTLSAFDLVYTGKFDLSIDEFLLRFSTKVTNKSNVAIKEIRLVNFADKQWDRSNLLFEFNPPLQPGEERLMSSTSTIRQNDITNDMIDYFKTLDNIRPYTLMTAGEHQQVSRDYLVSYIKSTSNLLTNLNKKLEKL